jgi:rhodanese-related sulfurtransferase
MQNMKDDVGGYPHEITVAALASALEANNGSPETKITVLDVREPAEVQTCALPDFVHIPLMDVPRDFASLPQDHALVVICHHGMRSAQAVSYLRQQGYENAINLQGGIDAWARQIDPSMPTY